MKEASYWIATAKDIPTFSSPLPPEVDAIVVGGGVAGLSTALHLLTLGKTVLVLESAQVGQGSTGHSTGMLTTEPGTDYAELTARHGLQFSRRMFDAMTYGVDLLQDTIETKGLRCGWKAVEAFAYGTNIESVKDAHNEWSSLRSLGASVKWLDRDVAKTRYPFLHVRSGVVSDGHATLDPFQLCLQLARVVRDEGGVICEGTAYKNRERDGEGFLVETTQGVVKTRQIFLCADNETGGWLQNRFPLLCVEETVIVTEPIDVLYGWEQGELMWNEFPLFEYARYLPDRRIMFGSGQSVSLAGTSSLKESLPLVQTAFEEMFAMPPPRIDYVWRNAFAVTDDELPYVGMLEPGVYLAGGYNGHGLVLGFLAGHLLAKTAMKQPHPYEDVFGLPHKRGRLLKALYRMAPRTLRHVATQVYLDQLLLRDQKSRKRR